MIPIRNIYYMLAYAFQVLHEQGYKDVAAEDFRNTAELLAAILCKGVSVQIKRGLCRQYITKEEPLASPRGKLEIGESIKTQVLRKKQLVCAYDEFSVNAYTNRIIKTTMAVLLRADITKARKKEIRKLLVFFDGVDTLDAHNINWNIQYDRNNQTYRMIIEICRFVLKGLLQTTADGSTRIMDYADDMTMANCMRNSYWAIISGSTRTSVRIPRKSLGKCQMGTERFCLPCSPTLCFQTRKLEGHL